MARSSRRGMAPVKDTYDVMLLPGKKHIAALRLEVLPDPSQPREGHWAVPPTASSICRQSRFAIRPFPESQDPPLVYLSRAEADINQKVKEDATAFDMFPGLDRICGRLRAHQRHRRVNSSGGDWSIVGDERKKPHEAVFLPLEPLDTNDASVHPHLAAPPRRSQVQEPHRPFPHQLHGGRPHPHDASAGPDEALELGRPIPRGGYRKSLRDGVRAREGHQVRADGPEEEIHQGRSCKRR